MAELPGTAQLCPGAQALDISGLDLPACDQCPNAKCVPTALVSATNPDSVDQLGACGEGDHKCVPEAYVISQGDVKLKACTSLSGAEGRCTSICIPLVASQGDRLPRDTCAEDERCAPCFDPVTGEPTGACSLGCTEPPTGDPVTFEKCCSDTGSCVPLALAGENADQLNPDTCSDQSGATLCAPDDIASDKPATCRSINDNEGRCLSRCLTTVKDQLDSLPQSSCPETHRCAPCYDPRFEEPTSTGACELNGDAPVEAPKPFSSCCDGGGLCVPLAQVPESQRDSLSQLSCPGEHLCTPKAAVADPEGGAFAGSSSCMTELSGLAGLFSPPAPGICAPLCFQPDAIPVLGGQPLKGTCASEDDFCAPCIHPTDAVDTGACPPSP